MEKERSIITTQLVKKLSGKPMEDWFKILDERGALPELDKRKPPQTVDARANTGD